MKISWMYEFIIFIEENLILLRRECWAKLYCLRDVRKSKNVIFCIKIPFREEYQHIQKISVLVLYVIFSKLSYADDQKKLSNYEKTEAYSNSLLGDMSERNKKIAELNMFISMIPKGGDLHHHYSGAIYAETYLDWAGEKNYCIKKEDYTIESSLDVINAQNKLPFNEKICISIQEVKKY